MLTFLLSFILVHVVKLAYLGILSVKKPAPAEKNEPEKEKPTPKPEPIYYIVEKKRTRKSYSNPKEIEFKK